jgi:phage tail-like protein
MGSATIGRQPGNDLVLDHPQVSRRHAQLDRSPADGKGPSECQITDLGSSNGTRVGGQELTPQVPVVLTEGVLVQIGPFELTFEQIPVEVGPVQELKPEAERALERVPLSEAVRSAPEPPADPAEGQAPPRRPSLPPAAAPPPAEEGPVPYSLMRSHRLLNYLPGIYHTDFMARFLAIFESLLASIEWHVDNFDLYLDPGAAPAGFIPWLANWFQAAFDPTWSVARRRTFLAEAHQIYARRGTRWSLNRHLEIYTGLKSPEGISIVESQDQPHLFSVVLRVPPGGTVNRAAVARIVEANKPAHTTYTLEIL